LSDRRLGLDTFLHHRSENSFFFTNSQSSFDTSDRGYTDPSAPHSTRHDNDTTYDLRLTTHDPRPTTRSPLPSPHHLNPLTMPATGPMSTTSSSTTTQTQTLTITTPKSHDPPPPVPVGTLRLRGVAMHTRRRIRWAEDVVDNEGLGRKSSKGAGFFPSSVSSPFPRWDGASAARRAGTLGSEISAVKRARGCGCVAPAHDQTGRKSGRQPSATTAG
jgi:hypothetical protein